MAKDENLLSVAKELNKVIYNGNTVANYLWKWICYAEKKATPEELSKTQPGEELLLTSKRTANEAIDAVMLTFGDTEEIRIVYFQLKKAINGDEYG